MELHYIHYCHVLLRHQCLINLWFLYRTKPLLIQNQRVFSKTNDLKSGRYQFQLKRCKTFYLSQGYLLSKSTVQSSFKNYFNGFPKPRDFRKMTASVSFQSQSNFTVPQRLADILIWRIWTFQNFNKYLEIASYGQWVWQSVNILQY